MSQIDPARLGQIHRKRGGFFSSNFPHGSLQRRLLFGIGIPILVLIFIYLIMNEIVMPIVTRHGDEFALPDFAGQPLAQAQVSLQELDLNYEVGAEEYSPGVEKGTIISQFPIAGTKVKEDRVIRFVISAGQKQVVIPDVSGLSVRQAMLDLETAGLELGEIAWAFSDTLPEKVVVFSYPASGTQIPLGAPVNLMVNRGRASDFTFMPRVVGLSLSEAMAKLNEKSLKTGLITHKRDENYLPETVLEQSEPEGTELDVSTEIDLVVSTTE